MITKWILLGETIGFGLMIALAVPVWAIIPMLFGARPGSDPKAQSRLAAVLFTFPLTAAACLITGWLLDPASPWMWVCLGGPLLHFALIFAFRIRK